jgi:hypothetical protein
MYWEPKLPANDVTGTRHLIGKGGLDRLNYRVQLP